MPEIIQHTLLHELSQPSAAERRDLLVVLQRVRRLWIDGVLEHLMEWTSALQPMIRPEPHLVENPWERVHAATGPAGVASKPVTSIGDIFDQSGRTLLILGEPGGGKTIALLTLARALVEQAERDPMAPVPVVFSLSNWARSRKSIHDWLITQLHTFYLIGIRHSMRWIERHHLVLLLDGLDEVEEEQRAACVKAIDVFAQEHGVAGFAVCCRTEQYLALRVRLKAGGAVTLLPLTDRQVGACLDRAGDEVKGLRNALDRDGELSMLAKSPLMLNIMESAFRGLRAEALAFESALTRDALRDQIFAHYVDRMFNLRERLNAGFSRKKTEVWLKWLAAGMLRRGESVFAVERLQPAALTVRQMLAYTLVSRVTTATTLALAAGLTSLGLATRFIVPASGHSSTSGGFIFPVVCVLAGLLAGLLSAPIVVLHAALRMVLALDGTMPRQLQRFLKYAVHLGILQRVGGGYTFIHRLLQEYFANRPTPNASPRAFRSLFDHRRNQI